MSDVKKDICDMKKNITDIKKDSIKLSLKVDQRVFEWVSGRGQHTQLFYERVWWIFFEAVAQLNE